jgi:hypothetical protein
MAKGGFKGPKSNAAMIATGIAIVVLIFIVYASFFMVPTSSDHRVLLVASDVLAQAGGPAKFASFLSNQSVAVVPYNYDSVATYAELGDLVGAHMASTGASRVRSVGIMYHTPNRYNLKCFASDPEKSTVSGSPDSFESFRRFVVALRAAYGVEDVDLISCDVVSAETSVLASLDYNGARVNASTNTTGQVKQGPVGDWVLELGNVNLIGRYFNASITTADLALTTPVGSGVAKGNVIDWGTRAFVNPSGGDRTTLPKVKKYIDENPRLSSSQLMQYFKTVGSLKVFPGFMGPSTSYNVHNVREWHINAYRSERNTGKSRDDAILGQMGHFTAGANSAGAPQK